MLIIIDASLCREVILGTVFCNQFVFLLRFADFLPN